MYTVFYVVFAALLICYWDTTVCFIATKTLCFYTIRIRCANFGLILHDKTIDQFEE
jgi:hypothetical protein